VVVVVVTVLQVSRMLPGGLAIVGAYLFAGADASSALLPKMHRLLHSIRFEPRRASLSSADVCAANRVVAYVCMTPHR
jgi:hypothetical protein